MIYVKPVEGAMVRDPVTYLHVPAIGRWVEPSQYWMRRMKEGSLVEATPPPDGSGKPEDAAKPSAKAKS